MLIDTHLHLSNEDYNIKEVLQKAKSNNVGLFITGGTNKDNNLKDIDLSKKYKEIYITLGYHPEYVNEIKNEDYKLLEKQIKENEEKVIAIGEIGLDYHYDNKNKDKQKEMFIRQINIAKKYNLPVVVHSREATEDTFNILKKSDIKGVIHCFSGSLEMAKKYISIGFMLGIGGVITFSNSNLKETVKQIDIKNILLETDSPYLSPIRGVKNEPSNIKLIAEFICDIKQINMEALEMIMEENIKKMFKINI